MDKHEQQEMQRQERLLAEIEEQLKRRALKHSELPWMSVSIVSEIEVREKAREWLARNGSLFALTQSNSTIREKLAALKSYVSDITGVVGSKRIWSAIGAVAGGGLAGYIISRCFPGIELLPAYSLAISLSVVGAIVAGLASQWQYLREYYF